MVRNSLSLSWQLAVYSSFRNWLGRRRMWRSALWEGRTAWVSSSRPVRIFSVPVFGFISHSFLLSSCTSAFVSCTVRVCNKWRWALCRQLIRISGTSIRRRQTWAFRVAFSFLEPQWNHKYKPGDYDNGCKTERRLCACVCVCVCAWEPVKHTVYPPMWTLSLMYNNIKLFPPDRTNVTTISKCWCHVMMRHCSPAAPMPSIPPAATIR